MGRVQEDIPHRCTHPGTLVDDRKWRTHMTRNGGLGDGYGECNAINGMFPVVHTAPLTQSIDVGGRRTMTTQMTGHGRLGDRYAECNAINGVLLVLHTAWLIYTSDAADDLTRVALWGDLGT